MYICIYIYIYIYTNIWMQICRCICICMCVCFHLCVYVCIGIHVYVYVYVYACVYLRPPQQNFNGVGLRAVSAGCSLLVPFPQDSYFSCSNSTSPSAKCLTCTDPAEMRQNQWNWLKRIETHWNGSKTTQNHDFDYFLINLMQNHTPMHETLILRISGENSSGELRWTPVGFTSP